MPFPRDSRFGGGGVWGSAARDALAPKLGTQGSKARLHRASPAWAGLSTTQVFQAPRSPLLHALCLNFAHQKFALFVS